MTKQIEATPTLFGRVTEAAERQGITLLRDAPIGDAWLGATETDYGWYIRMYWYDEVDGTLRHTRYNGVIYTLEEIMRLPPVADLLAALEPFANLALVLEPDEYVVHRGVYISNDQAQAAADAVAKAKGD
jgi:hypothetical protein